MCIRGLWAGWQPSGPWCTSRNVTETKSTGRGRKVILVALGALVVLAAAGGLALRAWLPSYVMGRVTEEAARWGLELSECGLEFERSGLTVTKVTLEHCKVGSKTPAAVSGTLQHVEVWLADEKPERVFISGADLTVSSALEFDQIQTHMDATKGVRVTGQNNRLAWVTDSALPPALVVTELQRLSEQDDWSGKLVVAESLDGTLRFGETARVELRLRSMPANSLVAEIDPKNSVGHVALELANVPFLLFSGILFGNVPGELATTTASGSLKLDIPYGLNPAQPKGQFDFTLAGLNFPVPRELAGLVYDTSPHLSGTLTSNRTYTKFTVPKLHFETGALRMKGKGNVERDGMQTHWQATLQGPLPCDAIVAAAARVHLQGSPLGDELASAAAKISRKALRGSVNILVALDAESSDLAAAKIVKSVGLGCGLEPLPVPNLSELPEILLKDLPQLKDLPAGLGTPPATSGDVPLPKLELPKDLPKIEIPGIKLPGLGGIKGLEAAPPPNKPAPTPAASGK